MRKSGPMSEYPVQVDVYLSIEQAAHVDRIARLAGVSRAAVLRGFAQDSLDRAEGVYSPFPTSFPHETKKV